MIGKVTDTSEIERSNRIIIKADKFNAPLYCDVLLSNPNGQIEVIERFDEKQIYHLRKYKDNIFSMFKENTDDTSYIGHVEVYR